MTNLHPLATCLLFLTMAATFSGVPAKDLENAIGFVHDPCIIQEGDYFYVFSTGDGIPIRRSKDLKQWVFLGQVFKEKIPAWAKQELPKATNLWAPDISFYHGRFHLLYSISSFGSNRSIVAAASNKTLNPSSPDYNWVDEGRVIESHKTDNYNAIDPNLLVIGKERAALTFGSFWGGIQLTTLDLKTGKPLKKTPVIQIARRPSPDAIEAPFLIKRKGWFYLFASYDLCCRGIRSTYNIRYGRSKKVEGPYLDQAGMPLLEDGGTQLLKTEGSVIGPGHCAVLQTKKGDFLIHHFYDGEKNGLPTLQVRPLAWSKEGWGVAGAPLLP